MATAPHVPPTATAAVTAAVSSKRLRFGNRASFPGTSGPPESKHVVMRKR